MPNELAKLNKSKFRFFGAAMFLRPVKPEQRDLAIFDNVEKILLEARKDPGNWESFLMKRNYKDFAWDNFGGNSEFGEFPADTMLREIREELGWKIKEYREVCRQWENGFLKGFVYLAIPELTTNLTNYMVDNPHRTPCDEVQRVKYINLMELLTSSEFKPNVKGRVRAFVENRSDFIIT